MRDSGGLAQAWLDFAHNLYGEHCPLNAALTEAVAGDRTLLQFVAGYPDYVERPMIFLAAVQYLVLSGVEHPVADLYHGGRLSEPATTREHLVDFFERHEVELRSLLSTRTIQTNEPSRSAPIALGIAVAATSIGEPIALVDAGASAGLNLVPDRYFIDYGEDRTLGVPESPVRLATTLTGTDQLPARHLPEVAKRVGIDRDPVDLREEASRRWILAFGWPGTERQARLRAAVDLVTEHPPDVRRGDMAFDMTAVLEEMQPLPTVVVTSWSLSFLEAAARRRFEEALVEAGRNRPLAWVCCDVAGVSPLFSSTMEAPAPHLVPSFMGLAIFDGSSVFTQVLANIDSYGRWIEWIGHSE
jgi:hypothetical protein